MGWGESGYPERRVWGPEVGTDRKCFGRKRHIRRRKGPETGVRVCVTCVVLMFPGVEVLGPRPIYDRSCKSRVGRGL